MHFVTTYKIKSDFKDLSCRNNFCRSIFSQSYFISITIVLGDNSCAVCNSFATVFFLGVKTCQSCQEFLNTTALQYNKLVPNSHKFEDNRNCLQCSRKERDYLFMNHNKKICLKHPYTSIINKYFTSPVHNRGHRTCKICLKVISVNWYCYHLNAIHYRKLKDKEKIFGKYPSKSIIKISLSLSEKNKLLATLLSKCCTLSIF